MHFIFDVLGQNLSQKVEITREVTHFQGWIKADFEAALKDLNSLMCDNKRYLKGVGACDA